MPVQRYRDGMTAVDAELREVVRRGATLLPRLVALVERCRTEPDPGRDLARACGGVISEYGALRERLWPLPTSPLLERVDVLLRFEQRILDEAVRLAYRPHTDHWPTVAKAFGDGLTDSSDELLLLAARL